MRIRFNLFLKLLLFLLFTAFGCQNKLPHPSTLQPRESLPNPLIDESGKPVDTIHDWENHRRPYLLKLFEHYVYGKLPPLPKDMRIIHTNTDTAWCGGLATLQQTTLTFNHAPSIHLLTVLPNNNEKTPVFLALNFRGNHTLIADSTIALSEQWIPANGKGVINNRATSASWGTSAHRWPIKTILQRGYGIATFYHGDVAIDTIGLETEFTQPRQEKPDQWGALSAWAYGLHRAVDYLETLPQVDPDCIAVLGHSRNGKAALWAGAADNRIALVISNQSGCGGAALSRRKQGETIKAINTRFPHWFCSHFHHFNDREMCLPVDQHILLALIAPRPLLVLSAEKDLWADPLGECLAQYHASPVYELYGAKAFQWDSLPPVNILIQGIQGYHIRPGTHGIGLKDWQVIMNFADKHLKS